MDYYLCRFLDNPTTLTLIEAIGYLEAAIAFRRRNPVDGPVEVWKCPEPPPEANRQVIDVKIRTLATMRLDESGKPTRVKIKRRRG